jgi:hypothetical protein
MGDVEEVVRQKPRRGAGSQRREQAFQERCVVGLGDRAERGDGWLGSEEDDAVGLRHGGGRVQLGCWGQRRPLPQRRDLDATALLVKAPPVVGALQHASLAVAERQWTMSVRTAAGETPHPTFGAVQDPGLTQEHDPVRLLGHLTGAGHRVPAPAERRVGVGEGAGHGATLVRPGTRRQGPVGKGHVRW